MFRKLAVAAVLVGMSVGSVAYGAECGSNGYINVGGTWQLTGPVTTLEDNPGGDFFDVFMGMLIIDDGDPGYAESDSIFSPGGYGYLSQHDGGGYTLTDDPWLELVHTWRTIVLDR